MYIGDRFLFPGSIHRCRQEMGGWAKVGQIVKNESGKVGDHSVTTKGRDEFKRVVGTGAATSQGQPIDPEVLLGGFANFSKKISIDQLLYNRYDAGNGRWSDVTFFTNVRYEAADESSDIRLGHETPHAV